MSHLPFEIPSYSRWPLEIARGQGSWVETTTGERYLDLYGGHAVTATGHCPPMVVEAVKSQAEKLLFYSNVVHLGVRSDAHRALAEIAPPPLARSFFVNSGSEAIENGIKLARLYTGKSVILSFSGGFHGRTQAALAATGIAAYRPRDGLNTPGHLILPFGDVIEVERAIQSLPVAGVLLEPIQSLGGVREAPPEFLKKLRQLCDRHGALLVYDEVQTGIGRMGDWFYAPLHDVIPDVIALGKALGSGIPMGAVLTSDKVAASVKPGDLGSTFGGGPLASAALIATIETIKSQGLLESVTLNSTRLRDGLTQVPGVVEVLGRGYLVGIRVEGRADTWVRGLFARRILAGPSSDPQVLRLMPPLGLTSSEIDLFLDAMHAVGETVKGDVHVAVHS